MSTTNRPTASGPSTKKPKQLSKKQLEEELQKARDQMAALMATNEELQHVVAAAEERDSATVEIIPKPHKASGSNAPAYTQLDIVNHIIRLNGGDPDVVADARKGNAVYQRAADNIHTMIHGFEIDPKTTYVAIRDSETIKTMLKTLNSQVPLFKQFEDDWAGRALIRQCLKSRRGWIHRKPKLLAEGRIRKVRARGPLKLRKLSEVAETDAEV
ncbi:hypothetical protein DENSPDRAFT_847115 [Dentipellis sp. KUC8613]|nr:hypothetical protein DENSPDRAFT_847115 [Dentipellis sp. KUC8613]